MMIHLIFLILSSNLLLSQAHRVEPPILEIDGLIFKVNDELPYTGKISAFWNDNSIKEEGYIVTG